jgi:propanediol dehydratase large subunit
MQLDKTTIKKLPNPKDLLKKNLNLNEINPIKILQINIRPSFTSNIDRTSRSIHLFKVDGNQFYSVVLFDNYDDYIIYNPDASINETLNELYKLQVPIFTNKLSRVLDGAFFDLIIFSNTNGDTISLSWYANGPDEWSAIRTLKDALLSKIATNLIYDEK